MIRKPQLLIVIVVLALAALACNLPGSGESPAAVEQPSGPDAPTVAIRVPVNGMSFAEGTNVIIQAVGTDSGAGVSRIDLQIDDQPAGSSEAPNPAGQSAFMANFEWPALGAGMHSITAVALRQDGTASAPVTISINVVQAPTAVPTQPPPEPTAVPEQREEPTVEEPAAEAQPEPTEAPTGPRASTSAGVNVRQGPSTGYPTIGSLLAGTEMDITGRNADNTWFRVPYYNAEGWIFGQLLTITGDVNLLPVINVPPPPPTATPIPTAIPATVAPAGPSVRFWSTYPGSAVDAGTPIRFYWEVSGVKAVYFQGEPVTGSNSGGIERIVNSSTTFTLRVVNTDDSTQEESIRVEVK